MTPLPVKATEGVLREPDLELPYLQFEHGGRRYRFSNANRVSRKRVDSFLVKEPTTIAWIDSFADRDVYVDVGANVGMYAVYAAARGARVYAFEPESLNYAELNKNLHLNALRGYATAYCAAVTDVTGPTVLYLSRFVPAFSHHDARQNRWEGPVTKLADSPQARYRQGVFGVTLADAVAQAWCPPPKHLKVDVDGWENKVFSGLGPLSGPAASALESVLVECDFHLDGTRDVMRWLEAAGWVFSRDQVTVHRDRKVPYKDFEALRAAGKGGCNVVYFRPEHADKYNKLFAAFRARYPAPEKGIEEK